MNNTIVTAHHTPNAPLAVENTDDLRPHVPLGIAHDLAHGGSWARVAAGMATVAVAGYAVLALSMVVIGVALTHISPITRWDEHVNASIARHGTPRLDHLSAGGTFVANTLGVVAVAVAVTVLLALRRWGRTAALLAVALGVELAVFLTANYTVERPRPTTRHLGSTPSTFSFPSGHVAATFALYAGIAVLVFAATRKVAARLASVVVAATATAWVGWSRVYRGQHHPTDVLAGLLLGIGALITAVLAVRACAISTQRRRLVREIQA